MVWQLQEAKSRFSQVVSQALLEGPQTVTRHGREVVVVISADEYHQLAKSQPSLMEALLNSPLRGSNLRIEREPEDVGRQVDL